MVPDVSNNLWATFLRLSLIEGSRRTVSGVEITAEGARSLHVESVEKILFALEAREDFAHVERLRVLDLCERIEARLRADVTGWGFEAADLRVNLVELRDVLPEDDSVFGEVVECLDEAVEFLGRLSSEAARRSRTPIEEIERVEDLVATATSAVGRAVTSSVPAATMSRRRGFRRFLPSRDALIGAGVLYEFLDLLSPSVPGPLAALPIDNQVQLLERIHSLISLAAGAF